MTLLLKTRIIGTIFIFLAVWPFVHRYLVAKYDVNPWRLFGAAMYCTSHQLIVWLIDESGQRVPLTMLPYQVRRNFDDFRLTRFTLGKFHTPEAFVRSLFTALPRVRAITVQVRLSRLDSETGMLIMTPTDYRYRRLTPEPGATGDDRVRFERY